MRWFDRWDLLTLQSNLVNPPQACAIIPVGPFINLPALPHTPSSSNSTTGLNSMSTYCSPGPLSFCNHTLAASCTSPPGVCAAEEARPHIFESCLTPRVPARSLKTCDQIRFLVPPCLMLPGRDGAPADMPAPSLLSHSVTLSGGAFGHSLHFIAYYTALDRPSLHHTPRL